MDPHRSPQLRRQQAGEVRPVALDDQVEVAVLAPQQEVAHEAADQVDRDAGAPGYGGDAVDPRRHRGGQGAQQVADLLAGLAVLGGAAVDFGFELGDPAVQVPQDLHAGDDAERYARFRAGRGLAHQHEARVAAEHVLADLVGRCRRRDPFEVALHHGFDRPLAEAVLERRVEPLAGHRSHRAAGAVDHRRGVDLARIEQLLGGRHRRPHRHHEGRRDHQVGGPRRRRQRPPERRQHPLARLDQGRALEPRRRRGGVPAAAQLGEGAAEVEAGHLAAGDHRHPLLLAHQGEQQGQLEDLQAAVDERRQLVDVGPQLDCRDPHPVAVHAVDFERPGQALQHLQPAGVELAHRVAPHQPEVAAPLQEPGRRLQVARAGGGEGQRAGVLVDAGEQQGRLGRRDVHPAPPQLFGEQRRGRARRRIDQPAGHLQVVLGRRVVVVGPDLDAGMGCQPLGDDADAAALADVAEDDPRQRGGVDVPLPYLGEGAEVDQPLFLQPAHRLLARAGEERPRRRVEPACHHHRGEGVEVGAEVGDEQLHAGDSIRRPAPSPAARCLRAAPPARGGRRRGRNRAPSGRRRCAFRGRRRGAGGGRPSAGRRCGRRNGAP